VKAYTAIGKITNGADTATIISGQHSTITGDEYIKFLNADATKPAAICESADDFGKLIMAAEEMCTALKSHCSNNNKQLIENAKSILMHEWMNFKEVDPE
jgi:hypothetical protein